MSTKLNLLQQKTLELLLEGCSTNDLAEQLYRTKRTAELYVRDLREFFDAESITGVIAQSAKFDHLYLHLSEFRERGTNLKKEEVLSDIEAIVLHSLLEGKSQKQISKELDFSARSVQYYRNNIFDKWQIRTNADLVIESIKKNYLRLVLSTPILNIEKKEEVLQMFQKGQEERGYNKQKYHLQLFTPNLALFRLTDGERRVLKLSLDGERFEDQARIVGKSVRTIKSLRQSTLEKLDVSNRIQLVLKSIDMGVIVIDNWQDHRIQTLKERERALVIRMGKMAAVKVPEEMKVPGFDESERDRIIKEIADLWKKWTIEGVIIDGLRRGDFTINELHNLLEYKFI